MSELTPRSLERTASRSASDPLGRALGSAVGAVTVLALLASAFRPAAEGRLSAARIATHTLLLAANAFLYFTGGAVRERWGTYLYLALQALVLFAFGLQPENLLLAIALFAALTAQAIRLLAETRSAMTVTLVSILVFCASTTISSGVYRGATVALILAVFGVVVRAVAPTRASAPGIVGAAPAASTAAPEPLTQRELQVLRMAAAGRRSREIGSALGISERTVKAHLAATYRKLGVETRAAAVARAAERGLLG